MHNEKAVNFIHVTVLFILLGITPAWGASATYYVDSTRTVDTGNGLTPATACKKISTCITKGNSTAPTATGAGQGHNYKLSGTFAEYVSIGNAFQNGATITGCTDNTFSTCGTTARDLVVNQGTGASHGFLINSPNVTVSNMSIWSNGSGKSAFVLGADSISLTGIHGIQQSSGAGIIQLGVSATNFALNSSLLESGNSTAAIYAGAVNAGGTIANNIFRANRGLVNSSPFSQISFKGTAKLNIYNNLFTDAFGGSPLTLTGSGGGDLYNNIIFGNPDDTSKAAVIVSNGIYTENNNIIYGSLWNPNRMLSGIINGGTAVKGSNTMFDIDPRFSSWGKTGYIVLSVDDSMNADGVKNAYLTNLANLMRPYGFHGSWYTETGDLPASQYENMRTLLRDGIFEIGAHSYSHIPGDATTAGTLKCTNCGTNPQYAINLSLTATGDGCPAHSLCVKTDAGGIENQTYFIGADNSAQIGNALAVIKAASGNKWGITYSTPGTNLVNPFLQVSSCNDTGGFVIAATPVALNTGVNADCSGGVCDRVYQNEVYNVKSAITNIVNGAGDIIDPQTGKTYVTRSFATPYGIRDPKFQLAIKSSGYETNRTKFGITSILNQDLRSFDVQDLRYMGTAAVGGATVEETKRKVRALCAQLSEHGLAVALLAHDESTSTTAENGWKAILSAIAEFGPSVKVVSAQELRDLLAAGNPWTWTPDATYPSSGIASRTYGAAAVDDNHLLAGSPALNAGAPIPGFHELVVPASDLEGRIVHFPQIGPYAGGNAITITSDYVPAAGAIRGTDMEPAIIKVAVSGLSIDLSAMPYDEAVNVVLLGNNTLGSFIPKGVKQVVLTLQPSVSTTAASAISLTGATLNGVVNDNGSSTSVLFEYGTSATYGNMIFSGTITVGAGSSAVTVDLTGLSCSTTYHFRVVATNGAGTTSGNDRIFTSDPCPVNYLISAATNIPAGGTITPSGPFSLLTGGAVSFTIQPASDYYLSSLSDNGIPVTLVQSTPGVFTFSLSNIAADHNVVANFSTITTTTDVPAAVPAMGTWSLLLACAGLGLLLAKMQQKQI